jgi:hypothetical protein
MTLALFCPRLLRTLALIAVAPIVASATSRSISELLSKLATEPLDPSIFFELESHHPEPRVFEALAEAFEKRDSKVDRQWIALTMLHLGNGSERYLDFLSGYAKQAIDDRTPLYYVYGPSGDVMQGEMSHEFERWCRENKRNPKEVIGLQFDTYPEDVRFLARAHDVRAAGLLRSGLESENPLIAYYSAEGLALLQDSEAIHLIVKRCERFPAATASFVAESLARYLTPDADLAMERFVKDPNVRTRVKREAVRKRAESVNLENARQKGKDRQ